MKRILCLMVISIVLAGGPWTARPAAAGEKLTLTMKATHQGLITADVPIVEKIFLPQGTRVRLVLDYADTNIMIAWGIILTLSTLIVTLASMIASRLMSERETEAAEDTKNGSSRQTAHAVPGGDDVGRKVA